MICLLSKASLSLTERRNPFFQKALLTSRSDGALQQAFGEVPTIRRGSKPKGPDRRGSDVYVIVRGLGTKTKGRRICGRKDPQHLDWICAPEGVVCTFRRTHVQSKRRKKGGKGRKKASSFCFRLLTGNLRWTPCLCRNLRSDLELFKPSTYRLFVLLTEETTPGINSESETVENGGQLFKDQ